MINNARNSKGLIDTPFFLSPKIRFHQIRSISFNQLKHENGFTLVELIVVVMMIGILSSIAIPQFMSSADKAKQKEATGIVAALVKAATAYNTEYGALPETAGEISEYAKFQECSITTAPTVATGGGRVCKGITPTSVPVDATTFYTSSGHYYVEFTALEQNDAGEYIFKVKANPNGTGYADNGSAVIGCYNPAQSVGEVYEFTAKQADRGAGKAYRLC